MKLKGIPSKNAVELIRMGEPQISHTVITEIAVALKMLSCGIIQPSCTITPLSYEIINVLITATMYLTTEVDSA